MSLSLDRVITALHAVPDGSGGLKACCPAHDDRTPSLSISRGDKQEVVFFCHAGCTQEAVIAALEQRGVGDVGPAAQQTSQRLQRAPRETLENLHAAHGDQLRAIQPTSGANGTTPARLPAKTPEDTAPEAAGVPIPSNAPPPPEENRKLGPPDHWYLYLDDEGRKLFFVCRWDANEIRAKEHRPLRWTGKDWEWTHWPAPRPLYGLDLLANHPAAPVLVVEGEKACHAARKALGDEWVVVTWPGGVPNLPAANLSPLNGRKVTIWPDNDEPGLKAAAQIVERVPGAVVLDVSEMGAKADAADVLPEEVRRRAKEGRTVESVPTADPHTGEGETEKGTEPEWEEESIVALFDKRFTPMQWVVPGILAGGRLAHIAGEEKSGKTTLLLQAAVALQKGGTFLGRPVPCGRTLYLDFDWNGAQEFIRSCRELGADRTDLITYINPQNAETGNPIIMDARGVESLRRSIRKHGDVKLVVIDNMVNALTSREDRRGYNAQETDARQLRALAQVAKEFPDVAFVIIGHTTKAGGKDPFSRYAGSRAIGGNVDIQLVLEGTANGTQALLSGRGRGGLKRYNKKLRRASRGVGWEVADDADELAPLQREVFVALRDAATPRGVMDLVRALGREPAEKGNVHHALKSLAKAGRVMQGPDRRWRLAVPPDTDPLYEPPNNPHNSNNHGYDGYDSYEGAVARAREAEDWMSELEDRQEGSLFQGIPDDDPEEAAMLAAERNGRALQ